MKDKIKEYFKNLDPCKVVMIAYHLLFLGGSSTIINGYLGEVDRLRAEIVKQADRADQAIDKVDKSIGKANDAATKLTNELGSVKAEIGSLKRACKKLF